MRFAAPSFSNLRLSRFHRLALLWLTWFAACLDAIEAFAPLMRQAHIAAHAWLDKIEHVVVCVAILRSPCRPRALPSKRRFTARPNRRTTLRIILGGRIRRALRRKDIRARINALRHHVGALIARRLRQLPCGLTRLFPVVAYPEAQIVAPLRTFFAPAPSPNSS